MAHMPIFGLTFFGHNSAIFGSIGQKFVMGTQETTIYRLVIRNPSYDAYFFIFGPLLAGNWAWPPLAPLMVWGFQTYQNAGPLGGNFGPTTISKSGFQNFQG